MTKTPFVLLLLLVCSMSFEPPRLEAQTTRRAAAEAKAAMPQTYRSRNFVLHTDLTADEANDLLKRLENMLSLISKYWGQPNRKTIECYVVKDIGVWPAGAISPRGLQSIVQGAGVTQSQVVTVGNQFDATGIVYAVSDRGTPQHEAVHAYCVQAFGTTGPVWYSEGMAEMGQYWKENDASVNADPVVVEYLRKSEPKSLNAIVNGEEFTGDSWQNYAWRWALCHLLANNKNYQARFRPLGLALLQQRPDVSFESVYGAMADEISFEYLFFLQHVELGYRVDLCSWDWKTRPKKFRPRQTINATIAAKSGWQPTAALLQNGAVYEYSAAGTWKLDADGDTLTADGAADGQGKLVGAIFADYQLSEPFELGAYGEFTSPGDGHLFVRCANDWGKIAAASGTVAWKIREKDESEPLPDPRSIK